MYRVMASLAHTDPQGTGEQRLSVAVVLELMADYLEGLEVRGRRGRQRRPGEHPDDLFTALDIGPGSRADRRLAAARNDLLR